MKLIYFASIRERLGRTDETVDLPGEVTTTADLVVWLRGRGPEFAEALADERMFRLAVDQQHVTADTELGGAREVALFPPMTGG